MTESIDTGAAVQDVLHRTAYDAGKTIGAAAGSLPAALTDAGYDPQQDDAGGGVERPLPMLPHERNRERPVVVADAQHGEVVADLLEVGARRGARDEAVARRAIGDGVAGLEHAAAFGTEDRGQSRGVARPGGGDQRAGRRFGRRERALVTIGARRTCRDTEATRGEQRDEGAAQIRAERMIRS